MAEATAAVMTICTMDLRQQAPIQVDATDGWINQVHYKSGIEYDNWARYWYCATTPTICSRAGRMGCTRRPPTAAIPAVDHSTCTVRSSGALSRVSATSRSAPRLFSRRLHPRQMRSLIIHRARARGTHQRVRACAALRARSRRESRYTPSPPARVLRRTHHLPINVNGTVQHLRIHRLSASARHIRSATRSNS